MASKLTIQLMALAFLAQSLSLLASAGYYRFPEVSGEQVYFTAEGDIWRVPLSGGEARRMTTHPAEETHAAISPDGRTIAFSAAYEGPVEVYTMPAEGGPPTRRTWDGEFATVVGWTPDSQLIYTTRAFSTLPDPQLVTLNLETRERHRIPLTPAEDGAYAADGSLFFVNPGFHRNNTRRYQGGTARDIWRFAPGDAEAVNLTRDFPGEDHSPMWWNGRVYYISERDGTMNLWSMTPQGTDLQQHTRHNGWDVLSAAVNGGRIAYRVGADIRVLDLASGQDRLLNIVLPSDFDQLREKWVDDPMEYLTSAHVHPSGESVVVTARGRVFVFPASDGRQVRISRQPGVRYRDAVFMPDGETVLTLSDESGEVEFWQFPANGVGDGRPVTADSSILRFRGHPSPDGARVAYMDKNNDLWIVQVEGGQQILVSTNREGVAEPAWSPDSRWLVYGQDAANTFRQLHLYNVEDGTRKVLTSDRVNSRAPAWSPDGRFLYFLSDRHLESLVSSPWGPRQPEPYFDQTMKIYELSLRKGLRSPFKADDETQTATSTTASEGQVTISLEGIERRIRELPVPPGNYFGLEASEQALFWGEFDRSERKSHVKAIEIKNDSKPIELASPVDYFELSADRKKIMIRQRQAIYILDAKASKLKLDEPVNMKGWRFPINVREDFRQLFLDAWRLERDYFYDPGMHGLDWNAMRDKYFPLVERVTTRMELSDLIGQLVGELSALHVSVRGGDHREGKDRIRVASLGALLSLDAGTGGYRIEKIYQADPDYPEELSPLDDPELDVRVGDIITAIDGVRLREANHPGELLRDKASKQVLLSVQREGEVRQVIVTPSSGESALRYKDWEYSRRLKVEEAGQGEIGYLHLQAMGSRNLTEWYRNFYPVFNRAGLIIDVRHNRGGNIDSILLEKLLRKAWFYWKSRVGDPYWNMQYAFRGHMVVLVDALTASDGEAFAEGFRRLELGKVIGTRTWGGEIWLSNNNRLSDDGLARAPQSGVYGPEGEWLIEGHGVVPDIYVENLPHATFNGEDAQLDAAIEHLQRLIREEPVAVPAPPPYPDKSTPQPPVSTSDGSGNPW